MKDMERMNRIEAVFFDVDGTLVSFDTHKIPDTTRQAIATLKAKGIKVFVATGRHRAALPHLEEFGFDGYITINGGYCTAMGDEVLLHHRFIEREDVVALLEYQEKVSFPTMVMEENGFFINYKDERVEEVLAMLDFPNIPIAPLSKALDSNVLQFVSFFSLEDESQILQHMSHSEATRWHPLFADIVPRGSNKSIGVEKMLAHYGIDRRACMAFGDGGNDVEMLSYVGVGVAMGNAALSVQSIADFVTDTVDGDGIHKALTTYQLI